MIGRIFAGTKNKKLKRSFSLILTAVLLFNILPFSEFTVAASESPETESYDIEETEESSIAGSDADTFETDVEQPTKEEWTENELPEKEEAGEKLTEEMVHTETLEPEENTEDEQEETDAGFYVDLTTEQDKPLFTFCGTEVRGSMSGSGWTYEDKENEGILTLDNFCLTDSDVNFMRTNFSKDLTIWLKGDNVVQTSGGFWSGLPYPDYVTITGEAGATLSFQSLEEGGFCMFQNVTIKDGVTVNFDTGQHVMLDDDLVIDNAQMNVQCNGKLSYLYVIHGSLEVKNNSTLNVSNATSDAACCIYMHKHMSVTDSTVSAINPNPGGLGIYVYYSSSNPDAARDITLTNSEVTAAGGVAGVHCDRMTLNKSALTSSADSKLTARVKYGEVVPDADSHIEGIVASYYGKDDDKPTVYDVYGETTLLNDLELAAGESFHIPQDTKLTIPEGVILTNEGTLHIYDSTRLDGAGTLTGSGNYDIDVTADLIDIPGSLCYTGKELNDKITLQDSLEIMGQTFTAYIDGWTLDTAALGTVKEAGDYTAKYTKDSQSIEKTFTVGMSAADISAKTYHGDTETDTFTVDDTITVKAVLTATGKAPEASTARMARRVAPTSGQMALFLDDTQISEAASAQADSSYTMTVNARDVLEKGTKEPNGSPITLTVKFIADNNMADAETTVEVKITAAAKVETDSGVTYYGTIEKAWTAAKGGAPATVTLLEDAELTACLHVLDNDDITLDGGNHILSKEKGTVISASGGSLTIQGGIFIGCIDILDESAVIIEDGTFTGNGSSTLYIRGSSHVTLSGGTFSNTGKNTTIEINGDSTLSDLLGQTDTTRFAYYDASGLIKGKLGEQKLTGTVIVKACAHAYTYTHTNGTTVHNISCLACGEQKADESCSYTGLDTEISGTCVCGSELTVALNSTKDPVYDGKEKKPEVTVTLDGSELAAEHYTVTYADNINAGMAVITLTGKDTYSFQEKVKFKIAPKPVTISGAVLKDRDYNGEKTVAIEQITLSGVVGTDDVAVDLDGAQGTLSSADAGTYTSVMLPELTLTGTAKGNYTLVQPTEAVKTSVTISPLDAEIIVGTDIYNKTFGDAAFPLNITSTNQEADVKCEVTKGEDVIFVSNKTVTVLSAGSAEITVSLPETTNYNAAESKIVTVIVAKQGGYKVDAVNRSYVYLEENTDTIDLAVLLPENCGTIIYGEPSASGNVMFKAVDLDNDGKLSYILAEGDIGDEGTIVIAVETQNYEDITVTVNVRLTDRLPVSLREGEEVTLQNDMLTYGETLSKLVFNKAAFVDSNKKAVEGRLAWKDAEQMPNAGTASAVWLFTPNDDYHETLEGTIPITVVKAVPGVTAPSVAGRVYNPSQPLKDSDLSGGSADGVDGKTLEGTWGWKQMNIVPTVDNSGYQAVFMPDDSTNYETTSEIIPVPVTKAVPYIAVLPAAASIIYGDTLDASILSGGIAQYGNGAGQTGNGTGSDEQVAGVFTWKEPSIKPAVTDSEVTEYAVIFTSNDTVNYEMAEGMITLTVQKAEKAPNMPDSSMDVPVRCQKVADVPLPEGWEWQDADKDIVLETGMSVNAVAVYIGADAGSYENETVTVVLTKSACDHVAGEDILYTGEGEKAPSCTEDGLGHRECIKCGTVVEKGIVVLALEHDYRSEVTKEPTVYDDGEITYTCLRCGDTYIEPIPRETPEGLWISGLEKSAAYTGSAIKPEGIRVYHGSTLLCEKTEYTISYKNNVKAGTAQVIVTGKGSYKGKATAEFTIEAVDLGTDSGISVIIPTVTETGKNLKPTVTVTWNGKKLKEKKDYTFTYDADIKTASAEGYDVTISGTGNYKGTIVRKFHVVPKGTTLLNSAKVTGIAKSYSYQEGKEIPDTLQADIEKLSVKIGKTTLTRDTDYTVRVENGNTVGTGTIVLEPTQTGAYAGEKRISFSITGTNLKKCHITGLEKTYSYTGGAVMPEIKVYTGKNGTGKQVPADAYTVYYSNYINKGKATVTVTGNASKGYSGSIKAVYSIGRLNIAAEESAGNVTVTMPADIKYAKGGAKPQPVITHTGNGIMNTLREGVDYTLKYSSNTSVSGKNRPALKITGIGNYSGTITKNFDIGVQDIGQLEITAADKAYKNNKKGSYYYSVPKVYDLDGRQLKSGKDYTVVYTNASTGQEIGKKDVIENSTEIRVTVMAAEKSSYTGTLSTTYYVRDAKDVRNLAKVKYDKIASQQYMGGEIRPEVRLYTQTGKTKNYLTAQDYEIIGYYNNIKKGTATILIRGINAYSGVKSITFKITAADNKSIWNGIF